MEAEEEKKRKKKKKWRRRRRICDPDCRRVIHDASEPNFRKREENMAASLIFLFLHPSFPPSLHLCASSLAKEEAQPPPLLTGEEDRKWLQLCH